LVRIALGKQAAGISLIAAVTLGAAGESDAGQGLTLLGRLDAHDAYSDVWGHRTVDVEVAIVGTATGTWFVDVTDPTDPHEIVFLDGPPAVERTIRTRNNFAYAANSSGGGLQIFSLADPFAPELITTYTGAFARAQSLFIDPDTGFLYAAGTETGLHVLDLTNPTAPSPVLAAPYDRFPVNAVTVRNGLTAAPTPVAFAVLNASLLPDLDLLAWVTPPGAAGPVATFTRDASACFVGAASATGGGLHLFDLRNLQRVRPIGEYRNSGDPSAGVVDLAVEDDHAFVVWNSGALEALDVSDPVNPESLGSFDTASEPGGGSGASAVYPFSTSETVYACDRTGGLYLLAFDSPNGTLEGGITDGLTGGAAEGVRVFVTGPRKETTTDATGAYRLNLPPGEHGVGFERFGFEPGFQIVEIATAETTRVDLTLERVPTGTLRGTVLLAGAGATGGVAAHPHPEGTIVRVLDTPLQFPAGLTGLYIVPGVPAGTHIVEADRFGYDAVQAEVIVTAGEETPLDFVLPPALSAENFELAGDWSVGSPEDGATAGVWARVVPIGTGAGYVQPEKDETPDPADRAFVTGNGPPDGWIDVADVDGGQTTLRSPIFDLSSVEEPILRFYRWFSNDGAWGPEVPDGDTFAVDASTDGGASWVNLETVSSPRLFWQQVDYVLSRYLVPSDAMQFRVVVRDAGAPSIVEAAVDDLEIFSGAQMLTLPVTPIDLGSVTVVSPAPGLVEIRWMAPGNYVGFDVERARDGARIETIGHVAGHAGGDRYSFSDRAAPAGERVCYWIAARLVTGELDRVGPFPVSVVGRHARSRLLQNVPNPFNPSTTIAYDLAPDTAGRTPVRLDVFDVRGRLVRTLVRSDLGPGHHRVHWTGDDAAGRPLPSGLYFYRLRAGGETFERALVLAR
jgi:hypothetical protein